ncbi:helix-turn-helix protein [Streptomyces sp. 846.5]|nr:helix-turn-helix domain-containing protein [Streptomyces sp. 846.5]TDT95341.1 helix-turn-helix protein [Streptomyces sp. 846.5]
MTDEQEVPPTVGNVVGENLRRIRLALRLTQGKAADRLARAGLNWKRTQLSDLESGRRESLDVGSLFVLAAAFEVQMPALFEGDGDVLLTPRADFREYGATATRAQLRSWVAEVEPDTVGTGTQTAKAALDHLRWHGRSIPIAADQVVAEKLGVDVQRVVEAAEQIWHRGLTEQRDLLVAELGDLDVGERQAKQGHITRQLTGVLLKWMGAEGEAEDG